MINEFNDINYIGDKLKERGYKLTQQRLQIIKAIYKNNIHMNADEIHSKVKGKNIGLSTVYRNVTILEEVGVLKKINITNTIYYELDLTDKYKFHIHAKCVKCNKIIDIEETEVSEVYGNFMKSLKERNEILIESTSIVLSGVCKDCEKKLKISW